MYFKDFFIFKLAQSKDKLAKNKIVNDFVSCIISLTLIFSLKYIHVKYYNTCSDIKKYSSGFIQTLSLRVLIYLFSILYFKVVKKGLWYLNIYAFIFLTLLEISP